MKGNNKKGFTLIEILVVIGIIAVLAAVVLIAINPARQFAAANDSQRSSNVNAILNAIGQHIADNRGDLPASLETAITGGDCDDVASPCTITDTAGAGNIDMCDDLVPTYIPSLPLDPDGTGVNDCSGAYNSKYKVWVDNVGRITVSAQAELDQDGDGDVDANDTISVTR